MIKQDNNLKNVLKDDGVRTLEINKFENLSTNSIENIKKTLGSPPWAARLVYNEAFGGVLICQNPGEGNRKHFHPDADECWIIVEGEWEWFIEGVGTKKVKKDDIIVVPKGTPHQIKCIGKKPGIRFAITKPDVNHVYV